jgi:hypothetical protein
MNPTRNIAGQVGDALTRMPRRRAATILILTTAVLTVLCTRLVGCAATDTTTTTTTTTTTAPPAATTAASAHAAAPPSTHLSPTPAADDDGVDEPRPPLAPTPDPDVTEAAIQFAVAWLDTSNTNPRRWHARLKDRATPQLAALLADVDLETVPVGKVGHSSLYRAETIGDQVVQVALPIVGNTNPAQLGTVTFTLVHRSGVWLVSEIDWSPR